MPRGAWCFWALSKKPRPRKWPINKSVRMTRVFPASFLEYKCLVPGR